MRRRAAVIIALLSLLVCAVPAQAAADSEAQLPGAGSPTETTGADSQGLPPEAELEPAKLTAPSHASGPVEIGVTVGMPDLDEWRLTVTDENGTETVLQEGREPGERTVTWETGLLAEGRYLLRLTATDTDGEAETDQARVTVKNPAPTLTLGVTTAEQGRTFLPVGYSSTSAADITLVVRYAGSLTDLARGEVWRAPAGSGMAASVPVDLSRLLLGRYVATVQVRDSLGRTATGEYTVQVVASAPRPALDELPAMSGQEVTLSWIIPVGAVGFEIHREGPDGTVTEPVPGWTPGTMRMTVVDRPDREGAYTYQVVARTADGLQAASVGRSTFVDLNPPTLGAMSVSPVDGLGLNLRWAAAEDAGGVAAYRVSLWDGRQRLQLAELAATEGTFTAALTPGSYQVILTAVDRLGREQDSEPVPFRVEEGAIAFLSEGKFLSPDVGGYVAGDQTWVPVRFFSDALGYQLIWDSSRRLAVVLDSENDRLAMIGVGDRTLLTLSGQVQQDVPLSGAAEIVEGRLMVPLRPMAEALGARIKWIPEIRTVEFLRD